MRQQADAKRDGHLEPEAIKHTREVCRRAEWREGPVPSRIRACSRSVHESCGRRGERMKRGRTSWGNTF